MQISNSVHLIPDVSSNTYLIVEDSGMTVIDAALPGNAPRIIDYMRTLGKAPGDLKRILLTHSDWDHVGSLRALHMATGARTYASQIEADAIAQGRNSRPIKLPSGTSLLRRLRRFLLRPRPFHVDEILTDGQVLPILDGLQVIDTRGHCPGHVSFFSRAHGILFCGDSMVTENGKILGSRPAFTWDPELASQAVKKQAALGARILCSGHGPVITDAAGKFPL